MPCYHQRHYSDLQAALVAEPDNPEAKALLYQRSVAVEKVILDDMLLPLVVSRSEAEDVCLL